MNGFSHPVIGRTAAYIDNIVANESWKLYKLTNDSILADLLFAQNKARIECPDCDKISIKFDPYILLSLPIPTNKYKTLEYTWIDSDTSIPATYYGQRILKDADIDMLKEAVAKSFNLKGLSLIHDYVREIQRTVTEVIPPEIGNVIFKFYKKIQESELYVVDVWKSKFHRV